MLNLNQSSLMIEGGLRGILSSQEGKSFEEIISFSKYIMEENKVAKLSEEIYKPDVEMNVDGIVDILITNIEMKWTEDDIFKIEESELFNDITKMNERNAVKVNNELARKRIRDAKQKAESKKVDEQKQPKQEKAKEEKKAEQNKQEPKTDSFRDILIKINDELARKRREEAKQKDESKKVDKQKQQPKEEKKAEPKDIRQKLIDMVNCRSIYDMIPEQEKEGKSFEDFQNEIQKINLDKIEDPNILEMVELISEISDDHYNRLKDAIHNAKSLEDMECAIAKVEKDIILEKASTFEGFKSMLVEDFKVKNLTDEEILTAFDTFVKAINDGELDEAIDKALEKANEKENKKLNRENSNKSINEFEERWNRYFHLNLKNKKRGVMKAYLYKKAKLYREAFGGNETPNNLCMRLSDIDRLLGTSLLYDTTITNNNSIMKAVAKYLEDVLNKDNFSNSIMRDLIDRCLPQFEDIVING